jgi:hypothetical protein
MKIKQIILAAGCALSFSAIAGTMGEVVAEYNKSWSIIGGVGYTWFQDAYAGGPGSDPSAQGAIGDGQTPFERLAIAKDFGVWDYGYLQYVRFGGEIGVQTGNIMRLGASQDTLDLLGGLPIQLNVKPTLDLLATASVQPMEGVPAFGVLKAGIAYRRLQIDERVTVNDLSQVAFDMQAGIGMDVSEHGKLSLVYQGIFGGNTNFTVNTVTGTGHISAIPIQNGVLLNLAFMV